MAHYENLVAWRECHALTLCVYRVTRGFPKDELYGLTSQARRAAFSAAAMKSSNTFCFLSCIPA